jgi:hypothetical protein
MKRTNKQPKDATPGFATRLTDESELGIAMLIAEDEDGSYEPLGPVATIGEAREPAQDDMRHRRRDLESGGQPLCPAVYKVWARGLDGDYKVAAEFDPSTL